MLIWKAKATSATEETHTLERQFVESSPFRDGGRSRYTQAVAVPLVRFHSSIVLRFQAATVNHLSRVGDDRWQLPQHAHIVVHERDGDGLLTIYDCGAAQKPPSAQLLGRLVNVDAAHRRHQRPNGYTLSMRESATLERQPEKRWVIRG